jgi:hypothetical protein
MEEEEEEEEGRETFDLFFLTFLEGRGEGTRSIVAPNGWGAED